MSGMLCYAFYTNIVTIGLTIKFVRFVVNSTEFMVFSDLLFLAGEL